MSADAKLTRTQKVLVPIINFLVHRFFPNGAFFGNSTYLDAFERHDAPHGQTGGRAAAMFLIRNVVDNGAEGIDVTVKGHTIDGIPTGDWRVSVDRVGDTA